MLDLIFYMGVVCLPFKTDYGKDDNICPHKPIMHEMGMSSRPYCIPVEKISYLKCRPIICRERKWWLLC